MSFRKLLSFHGRRKDVDLTSSTKREPRHRYRNTYAKGRRITHSERQQTNSLHTHVTRDLRGAKLQPQQLRPVGEVVVLEGHRAFSCCKIVMLEQHQPQPRRASARSHARGGRSGSAQSRQPAAAEAPDTHTRGGQLGLGQSGRHDYGCGAGTRARWRLTSVVGCHRVDQESTGAARAPIAPRHIFAGVHFGGSRMRRPRSCTCGMLHCLLSGYVPRGCLDGRPDSPAAG